MQLEMLLDWTSKGPPRMSLTAPTPTRGAGGAATSNNNNNNNSNNTAAAGAEGGGDGGDGAGDGGGGGGGGKKLRFGGAVKLHKKGDWFGGKMVVCGTY